METDSPVTYSRDLSGVDWRTLTEALRADHFDAGRTPGQLCAAFSNSFSICFALAGGEVIGKARALSGGVCNAYVVDVWTHHAYRRRGIATEMMRQLFADLEGQHVLLTVTPGLTELYAKLGFAHEPNAMDRVIGQWLRNATRDED